MLRKIAFMLLCGILLGWMLSMIASVLMIGIGVHTADAQICTSVVFIVGIMLGAIIAGFGDD